MKIGAFPVAGAIVLLIVQLSFVMAVQLAITRKDSNDAPTLQWPALPRDFTVREFE